MPIRSRIPKKETQAPDRPIVPKELSVADLMGDTTQVPPAPIVVNMQPNVIPSGVPAMAVGVVPQQVAPPIMQQPMQPVSAVPHQVMNQQPPQPIQQSYPVQQQPRVVPMYSSYQQNGGSDRYANNGPTQTVTGFLDVMMEGHGFLRPKFIPSDGDIYISQSQIRKFQLREGDQVVGQARPPKDNERYFGLLKVETVNEMKAEESQKRRKFSDLTPVYPDKQMILETGQTPVGPRIIDLLSPIGFGQRGLIVSPPKAGKTTILKELAHGISVNYPKAHLMAVLIGERPEEVTDIARSVKGEVIASNFDEAPQAQTKVAEVALDRAKRLVELGKDVVILLDSITRLARAYNLSVTPSGRTLTGGFDPAALYPAKRFLGAARNSEKGGSLTILGTALIETGSRMDDLIYEEFKGTGNMELHLSRSLQEQRVFPAIEIDKSGTRHDELLLSAEAFKKIVTLRHMMSLLGEGQERTIAIIDRLSKTKNNKEFLASLNQGRI